MSMDQPTAAGLAWEGLGLGDLWCWPLPALPRRGDRTLLRLAATLARGQVRRLTGWERVLPERDPFVLVANHGSRRETLYLVAALMLARGGRPVHFLADWNFRLIPGVGYLYDRSGAITVIRKDARPSVLNRLKPRFASETPAMDQARARLQAGTAIALFPEGTVNRDSRHLLRGRFGAARLSLETGVPVLPMGIRFLGAPLRDGRSDLASPMDVRIGAAMTPPSSGPGPAPITAVRHWHADVMTAIAALCGKQWAAAPPVGVRNAARSNSNVEAGPTVGGGPRAEEA